MGAWQCSSTVHERLLNERTVYVEIENPPSVCLLCIVMPALPHHLWQVRVACKQGDRGHLGNQTVLANCTLPLPGSFVTARPAPPRPGLPSALPCPAHPAPAWPALWPALPTPAQPGLVQPGLGNSSVHHLSLASPAQLAKLASPA